jgi:hypothetical protein
MNPFTITAWNDPLVEEQGHHPLSVYVELFWLPTLGPTATWLLRRSAIYLLSPGDDFTVDFDWLARSLGLDTGSGRHAPLPQAIDRCMQFGVAKRLSDDRIAMRRMMAPLPDHHVAQLDPLTKELHRTWHHRSPQARAALESV